MSSGKHSWVARAPRFPLRIPLQYCKMDSPEWHSSRTINISRTGILFKTDEVLPTNTTLKIRVQFPVLVVLSCQGLVVRNEPSACAVHIRQTRLTRKNSRD